MSITGRAFDHVLIIMFENQYRSYVMNNAYMRGLAAQGVDLANHFGVMHPSQTNYVASIAGELCNVTDDDAPSPLLPQRTIVELIEESPLGLRWRAYMDSYIPQNTPWTPDLVPQDDYPYVIKHNPFSSFANIVRNPGRWRRIVSESRLFEDLLNGTLPEYAWFTPNMWNDGHYLDGTREDPTPRAPALVDQLAAWLESFFGALRFPGSRSHLPPNTLVVVTFDEADYEADYEAQRKYTYDGPNQIYTVLLGDGIRPGVEQEGYNHYSLLKTIERNFGLDSLGKNDRDCNWFRFLWGETFEWTPPVDTPIPTVRAMAAADLQGVLHVVFDAGSGDLQATTFDGEAWSEVREVGLAAAGAVAMACCEDALILVAQDGVGTCHTASYDLHCGWVCDPDPIVEGSKDEIALVAYDEGSKLMLVWSVEGGILSMRYSEGSWRPPTPVADHTTGGPLTLAVLGGGLYLIAKAPTGDHMNVVSYNAVPFNVVTVPEGQYGGAYDDTTLDVWSPSAFPVAHFSHGPNPLTKGEDEPILQPYGAGGVLVAATLDGVIHLAHPGLSNPLVLTETFSISGVMTAAKPVSYNKSDEKTTSNGYGTLAQAGWSAQRGIPGLYSHESNSAMAMARSGSALAVLSQSGAGGGVRMCVGRYR